jgi:hypothetical protein
LNFKDLPCNVEGGRHTVTVWLARVEALSGLGLGQTAYLDPCPDGCTLEATCDESVRLDATLAIRLAFGIDGYVRSGAAMCDGGLATCRGDDGERQRIVIDRRATIPNQPRDWLVCGESATCEGVPDGEPTFPDGMKANPNVGETLPTVVASLSCGLLNTTAASDPTLAASDLHITCGTLTRTLSVAEIIAGATDSPAASGSLWVSGTHVQWELTHGIESTGSSDAIMRTTKVAVALAMDTEASGETCALSWVAAASDSADDFTGTLPPSIVRVVPAFRFGGAGPVADASGLKCFRDMIGADAGHARIEADFQPRVQTSSDAVLQVLPISLPWVGSAP